MSPQQHSNRLLSAVALLAVGCSGGASRDDAAAADLLSPDATVSMMDAAVDADPPAPACTFQCSAGCAAVCDAFDGGSATLWTLPDVGTAHLAAGAVAADASVHHDGASGHDQLVLVGSLGADADWQPLGLRLRQSWRRPGAKDAASFDLGPIARAPTAQAPLRLDLAPLDACRFERVELYRRADGATVASSPFRNPGEGGTWLCATATFIDPFDPCGASQANAFSFTCE